MHRYLLPTHVYWCIAEHCAVFLDLKRDKYFGLTPEQSVRLQGLTESGSVSDEHVADLCRELLECGLLTSEQSGKELRATSLSRADAALLDPDEDTLSPTLEWHHLVNLLYAVVSAWLALRICPLGWTIRKLQHRERVANGANPPTLEFTRKLIAVFRIARTFLYAPQERCLFDSLVLIKFLDRYSVSSQWVFGVVAEPFAAHCWVEHGPFVINDSVDHIQLFTPIMRA